jgi:predicted nucleic acid-binding protein
MKENAVEKLLMIMGYEYVYTPDLIDDSLFRIRDVKDYPVLYTAVVEDVDILITGDKDFSDIEIEKPKILTPAEFMQIFL